MTPVFLDTVGLIALWDQTDQWHPAASAVHADLLRQQRALITTPLVLVECANAAARRPYRPRVNALRLAFAHAGLLIEPTPAEWDTAWAAYDRGDAAQAGVVDHLSFAVMRRLGLTEAFTNDRHFQAAGFVTLF
jgi:predicted nucleic acid-binding protein